MEHIISDKVINLLNFRIQKEEESARIYLSMSNWLNFNGFNGAGKLWAKYSEEEIVHSKIAYEYLLDLDINPVVPVLSKPPQEFKGFTDIILISLDHEKEITMQCQELAKVCIEEGDFMTLSLAQKYLSEQVEEIAKTTKWADRIDAFGEDKIALRLLDNEMGEI